MSAKGSKAGFDPSSLDLGRHWFRTNAPFFKHLSDLALSVILWIDSPQSIPLNLTESEKSALREDSIRSPLTSLMKMEVPMDGHGSIIIELSRNTEYLEKCRGYVISIRREWDRMRCSYPLAPENCPFGESVAARIVGLEQELMESWRVACRANESPPRRCSWLGVFMMGFTVACLLDQFCLWMKGEMYK